MGPVPIYEELRNEEESIRADYPVSLDFEFLYRQTWRGSHASTGSGSDDDVMVHASGG